MAKRYIENNERVDEGDDGSDLKRWKSNDGATSNLIRVGGGEEEAMLN